MALNVFCARQLAWDPLGLGHGEAVLLLNTLLNRAENSVEEFSIGILELNSMCLFSPPKSTEIIVSVSREKNGHIGSPFSDTAILISEPEGGLFKIPFRTDSFADLSISLLHFCHLLPIKLVEYGSTWTAPSLGILGHGAAIASLSLRFPFIL